MTKTALITGASSGIGLELANIHASKGDNLILVARSFEKMKALKFELENSYKISVHLIKKDLSLLDSAKEVYDEVKQKNIAVDYLINNAGFGDYGMFYETSWGKEQAMINLNITALTQLTKLFVVDMVARKSGKIMNVASTAAFQAGPSMAVYFATKAYVLSFSEAIQNELKDFGITVTALCPGATESGFTDAANLHESKLMKGKKLPSSKEVATFGYEAMMNGETVAIHGFMNKVMALSSQIFPRKAVVKILRQILDKSH